MLLSRPVVDFYPSGKFGGVRRFTTVRGLAPGRTLDGRSQWSGIGQLVQDGVEQVVEKLVHVRSLWRHPNASDVRSCSKQFWKKKWNFEPLSRKKIKNNRKKDNCHRRGRRGLCNYSRKILKIHVAKKSVCGLNEKIITTHVRKRSVFSPYESVFNSRPKSIIHAGTLSKRRSHDCEN